MARSVKGALVPVPAKALRDVSPSLRGDLRRFFALAGLHFAEDGRSAIRIRSDGNATGLVLEVALQSTNGKLRGDVIEKLSRRGPGFDAGTAPVFQRAIDTYGVNVSRLGSWELRLMQAPTASATVDVLKELVDGQTAGGQPLLVLRLVSTDRLFRRLFLLELIDSLLAGISIAELRAQTRGPWISGLVELQPHAIVCPPLIARNQPLAAAVMTPFLTAVVLLPLQGGFIREVDMSAWPTGMSALRLSGPGSGVYTGMKTIPKGHARELLSSLTAGANRLLHRLTAPEYWMDETGLFLSDERRMSWTSVRIGLDAVASVGAQWSTRQSIWEAFRALTVLSGFWGDVPLYELLTPERIESHAVPAISNAAERAYASAIVAKYDQTISKAFGEDAPAKVAHVRHLVHGVAARGLQRTIRLQVLRELEESNPDLQLVEDVATLWWQAMLLSPETHLRPGLPPWAKP